MHSAAIRMRSVHAVEDVAKAIAFLADERVGRHLQVLEEDLRRGVVDHRLYWIYLKRRPALAHVHEEHR